MMGTNSFRLFNRRMVYAVAAFAMVMATIVPVLAFAATATERSVALSNSAKATSGVSYEVSFKAATAGTNAFIVDFCDSPTINTTCTAPAGLNVTTPTVDGANATAAAAGASTVNVTLASTAGAGDTVDVKLGGLTTPTNAGPIYARIVTYTDASGFTGYDAAALGTHLDDGSVAISITDSIGVSGVVKETMTFCVSSTAIADDCAGAALSGVKLTNATTGEALDAGQASTADIYTQISTNASQGAVVSLKSNALDCGGLLRAGAGSACDIKPASPSVASEAALTGNALFGVKAATTDTLDATKGTFVQDSAYDNFYMNYVAGNATGVTSVYGDPILNTASAPASNRNVKMTFGASINNTTPAGLYSATLSLIATGKF